MRWWEGIINSMHMTLGKLRRQDRQASYCSLQGGKETNSNNGMLILLSFFSFFPLSPSLSSIFLSFLKLFFSQCFSFYGFYCYIIRSVNFCTECLSLIYTYFPSRHQKFSSLEVCFKNLPCPQMQGINISILRGRVVQIELNIGTDIYTTDSA